MADLTTVLVDSAAAAGPADPSTEYIVLDMAWSPSPGSRPDLQPIRPLVSRVLRDHNLFFEALDMLDAVAASASLAERFTVNGVTWWYHARSSLVTGLSERLLWCHLLVDLLRSRDPGRLIVRGGRPGLVDAAAAIRPVHGSTSILIDRLEEETDRPPGSPKANGGPVDRGMGLRGVASLPAAVGRRLLRAARLRGSPARTSPAFDAAALERRIDEMAARRGSVLAIEMTASFHTVERAEDDGRIDPYVSPILERLADRGLPVAIVALGLEMRRSADRAGLSADPRLVPASYLVERGPDREAVRAEPPDLPELSAPGDGFDLGPSLRSMIVALDPWIERQRAEMAAAEALIERIQPRVVVTGWEAARTAWLGAASRSGIPSVAIQHGVVYPRSPDYERPAIPGHVRPDRTCVFGPYERDMLVERAGYPPTRVVVTGSPRIDRAAARTPSTNDERERVRSELGVDGSRRLLVISAGRRFMGDTIGTLEMAARLLDGPLPGVHIVVKLHPEARDDSPHKALFDGLAVAGGYPPTPVTVVRDIDLYRLMRSADAHLGLHSTVLTDAVMTDTPNMIAVGQAWEDIIGYVEAGVAQPVRDVVDVRRFMEAPARADPDARERFLDRHFLPGDAVERIADTILDAAAG